MRVPASILASSAILAVVVLAPMRADTGTCKDNLADRAYACSAVSNAGEQIDMLFEFGGTESGLILLINDTAAGRCACKAKKANINKADKIQFDASKDFHCVMGGVDTVVMLGGTEGGGTEGPTMGGAETFEIGFASYEGKAKKKDKIQKGEAVDVLGRQLVYGCEEVELGGPEMGGGA